MIQKTILCYGDSNTWGYVPNSTPATKLMVRYPRHERWPGILQALLGEKYYVIEEGLNGRTTNLDYLIPPDRNGRTYLPPCLYTHSPIDLIILGLGANDLKVYFDRSPEDICNGLAELIDIIQTTQYGPGLVTPPQILITTTPILLPIAETFTDEKGIKVFAGARKKAELLIDLYFNMAKTKKCHFLDVSNEVFPSEIDGGHFDAVAHKVFAALAANKINNIFS